MRVCVFFCDSGRHLDDEVYSEEDWCVSFISPPRCGGMWWSSLYEHVVLGSMTCSLDMQVGSSTWRSWSQLQSLFVPSFSLEGS